MEIAVVGAGVIGSTLAIKLTHDGHAVTLFERRTANAEGVALTLHDQGIRILESIGVHVNSSSTSGMTLRDFSGTRLASITQEASSRIATVRFSTLIQAIQSRFQSSVQLLSGTTVCAVTSHRTHMTVHTNNSHHSFDAVIVAAGRTGRALASYAPTSRLIGYQVARAIVPRSMGGTFGERWGPGVRAGRLPIDSSWEYIWVTISQREPKRQAISILRRALVDTYGQSLRDFHSVYSTKPPTRREIATNAVPVVGDAFMTTAPEGGLGVTRGLIDAHRLSLRLRNVTATHTFIEATRKHMLSARHSHARSLALTNILAESHSINTTLFEAVRSRALQIVGDRGLEMAWSHLTRSIETR